MESLSLSRHPGAVQNGYEHRKNDREEELRGVGAECNATSSPRGTVNADCIARAVDGCPFGSAPPLVDILKMVMPYW